MEPDDNPIGPHEALEAETLAGSFRSLPPELDIFGDLSAGASNRFAAEMLAALGHTTRLRIVNLLRKHPMTVTQLTAALGISQANVSQHLGVLLRAGALVRTADGATRHYSLRGTSIARLLELVEDFRQAHREEIASELAG
jgi:DNA-binding transcriptional ArsR family regulator